MSFASGSEHTLHYVAETVAGTTPATPAFRVLRNTGVTLALSKDAIQSEELGGRRIRCFRHGNRKVDGDVSIELGQTDFDDMLQAVMCGTWATGVLRTDSVRRTFTFERNFVDIAQRIRYRGCEVNELSLTVTPNSIVSGSLTIVGNDQDNSNAAVAGATYVNTTTACPFDGFSGAVLEGGSTIATVTQIELTIANGIEPLYAIGTVGAIGKSIGRTNISGTVTAYFGNVSLLNKFLNETLSSLSFTLTNSAGASLQFNLPRIVYNGAPPNVSGDGAVTIALPFQALFDTTANSELVITRTPA
jgi:hypothetical protein